MSIGNGVIVGYGNPSCGDDALGWVVVESLSHHPAFQDITLLTTQQLTPELAVDLQAADWVYFVDVSVSNTTGNTSTGVRQYPVKVAAHCDGVSLLGHHLAPEQLLALTRQCFGLTPSEAYVLTCDGQHFEMGAPMSSELEVLVPEFVAHLCREMARRESAVDKISQAAKAVGG